MSLKTGTLLSVWVVGLLAGDAGAAPQPQQPPQQQQQAQPQQPQQPQPQRQQPQPQQPQQPAAAASAPAVNPAVVAALERMGGFLRKQQSLEVRGEALTDDVLPSGQKVQLADAITLKVRRPDRLRAEVHSDRKTLQFFFDGKTFTMYGPRSGYYTRVAAPPTIRDLIEELSERYAIEMPLADLFYWGTDKSGVANITGAVDMGSDSVAGVKCQHYAFRQPDVDWQLWIQHGEEPLPRKLIVTNVREPTQPQYQVVINWMLNARFDDAQFAFTPPKGAMPVALEEVRSMVPRARQGRSAPPAGRSAPPPPTRGEKP